MIHGSSRPAQTPAAAAAGYDELLERIRARKARVAILGLGYVGLPLACALADAGFDVDGFDPDSDKVRDLNAGKSYIPDVPGAEVARHHGAGKLRAHAVFDRLAAADAIIICVPTPLRKTKDPDISYILNATLTIAMHLRRGQLVVLESTTYPGTTRDLLLPAFERTGLKAGQDFFLAFSPERVDPGNPRFNVRNTPKVVGGLTPRCRDLAMALYSSVVEKIHPVSSPEAAEMTKLIENTFRSVNIAFANEMALICDQLGLDIWEVLDAAKTKPFGYMPFYPGPGVGGHCIPLDPMYLIWKVRGLNFEPRFLAIADQINSQMPGFVVNKAQDVLNDRLGKALARSTVLAVGVAYKRDATDVRESPALGVIETLKKKGAHVVYHDPFVPTMVAGGESLRSQPLTAEAVRQADLVMILTDHSGVDYGLIAREARAVFDTRNALKGFTGPNIFRL